VSNDFGAGPFEYLVVGGGTAGCVLASRLSEQPGTTVCLVEAGPDFTSDKRPPVFRSPWGEPAVDAEFFWAYQASVHRDQETPTFIIRGRVTGGSSAINGAEWVRALPEDYDSWGSSKWSFESVLPSLCRAETDIDFGTSPEHGDSGPIPVRRYPRDQWGPLHEAFYDAAVRYGFDEKPDFNNPAGSGIGTTPMNLDSEGTRMDAARAYLDPARGRANLTVVADSVARRILWDKNVARGVEVDQNGERLALEAGEVVLTSGAIASPQLLLLSGVGPADDLRSLGISVVADLPGVGKNLQDHPSITLPVQLRQPFGIGPSSPVLIAYTATGSPLRNDMVLTLPWYRGNDFMDELLGLSCRLNAAAARGQLSITSPDAEEAPEIDYRYLEDEQDRSRMRESVRYAFDLARQEPLAKLIDVIDAPTDDELASTQALDSWVARHIATVAHSCGTCKMGSPNDPEAVVDDDCRVRGVEGLRIVDLSVVPSVPRANTGSTAVMLGERAAQLIAGEGLVGAVPTVTTVDS
jgi:choline dehydrogenase